MRKIKCFIECLIPVTVCNLRCSYCYVIQRDGRSGKIPELQYPIEVIKTALSQERFGGVCYFSICGAGETLAPKYTLDIVKALLENGHYANVTTNGTLSKRFEVLRSWSSQELSHLHFAFSYHYLELKRIGKLDVFFRNVSLVRSLGCSFVVQLNLCDEYLPYLDDIKETCQKNIGAFPQVAATRKELELNSKVLFETELSDEEYIAVGKEFNSPLFDFTIKNFNVKRNEYCYAGAWAFQLDLLSGRLKPCYHSTRHQNIYKNVNKPIKRIPVGRSCGSLFCMNSSHFMSLGVIPELCTPTYSDLRDRPEAGWYSSEMKDFLNGKLGDANSEDKPFKRIMATLLGRMDNCCRSARRLAGKIIRFAGFGK